MAKEQLCDMCKHRMECTTPTVFMGDLCVEYASKNMENFAQDCPTATWCDTCTIDGCEREPMPLDGIKCHEHEPVVIDMSVKDGRRGLCLLEAFDIINGGAEKVNDDNKPEDSFLTLGEYWGAFLRSAGFNVDNLKRSQVCTMLAQLKFARMTGQRYNPDNYRDGTGYTALADYYRKIEEVEAIETVTKEVKPVPMGEYPDPNHNE